ncbi:MAG: TetR/AcrR family transcriptional regulator [Solirubrobacteraceae bacterium]|nr:TetR/AcrR family transcriptional regulator [Solirubrobacteraceae bacterium]
MPRTTRSPESRERVVAAAWRVVADVGVQDATMRRIAAEAGVTTGSVTHHFADKHDLLAAVVRHNNLLARDRIVAAVGDGRGLVALEGAVDALLPIDADRRREWQVGVACWGPAAPGDRAAGELRDGWRYLERLLAALFDQAVEDGELPPTVDAGYEAARMVVLVAGVGMLAGVESPERVRRDAKRMLADQLQRLEEARTEDHTGGMGR